MDLNELLDRAAVTKVVNDWGLNRDTGRWDALRDAFTADGTMHTTWLVASADEFVARSREAAARGVRGQHFIGAASIELRGDRAIADTRMMLLLRAPYQGVEVDVTLYGRFYDLFLREADAWRIRRRVPIYEKDRIDPVDPAATVRLEAAELARYPDGYKHLACIQAAGGLSVTPDLPVPGSASLTRLYEDGRAWLGGA